MTANNETRMAAGKDVAEAVLKRAADLKVTTRGNILREIERRREVTVQLEAAESLANAYLVQQAELERVRAANAKLAKTLSEAVEFIQSHEFKVVASRFRKALVHNNSGKGSGK